MEIAWIDNGFVQVHGQQWSSPLASARYRIISPAAGLAERGHQTRIIDMTGVSDPNALLEHTVADVFVFGKLLGGDRQKLSELANRNIELADAIRRVNKRVVVDLTDNHFATPVVGDYYRALIALADNVVACSRGMAEVIHKYAGRAAQVIGDPVEGSRGEVRFELPSQVGLLQRCANLVRGGEAQTTERSLRLLWFGHPSNLATLQAVVPEILTVSEKLPLLLHVVTAPGFGAEKLCTEMSAPGFGCQFTPWSEQATWKALADCDLVVLPSDIESERKNVKSENRLTESIWAGRYVVAHPIPSYEAFQQWAWISEDLAAGISWALSHEDTVRRRIGEAQRYVETHHSRGAIAEAWEEALTATAPAAVQMPVPGVPERGVRLNLGCGDKILPGYVNVDVAESRKGMKPDVLCDLHQLTPFEDGSVDEILSVHVIEHFWRWEVPEILKEWLRVLRPGGKMILECPNLLSACMEFINNPELAAGPGQEGQRTMWVFYGDPAWRDPLMVHRWGYTPESLSRVMAEAGLTNVRQEPAQFKLREPRDMRITGEKPAG